MRTSNYILNSYQLKDLNDVFNGKVEFEIHGGGRYLRLGNNWVTANAVTSRIKALAKVRRPQDNDTFHNLIENVIAVDNRGYVALQAKIKSAKPFAAFVMKTKRCFKTFLSQSKFSRHKSLRSLLHKKTPVEQKTERIIQQFHQHVEQEHRKPLHQMKRFYAKVLETTDLKSGVLDGYYQSEALLTYLKDLILFKQIAPSPNLDRVINELEFAYKISLIEQLANHLDVKDAFIDEIQQKIYALPPSGASVLIPGGCYKHAILYKVEKDQRGLYSFTVINTGAGADFNYLRSAWTLLVNQRLTVQDIVYSGLTRERFSKEFISNLLTLKDLPNMDSVNQWVEESLMKGKVQWDYGRRHKAQRKGTCAFKSISSTLHEKLGDKDYNSFKAFLTKQEINNLERLQFPANEQIAKAKMLEEGRKVLLHRQSKIK